jgi:hypothetical protein
VTSVRVLWTPSRVDHRGLDAGGRARLRSAVARRRRISNGEEFVAHKWLPLSNMVVPRFLVPQRRSTSHAHALYDGRVEG